MNVLLSWLRDYIEIDSSAEQVAETLSNLGLPYEGIRYIGDDAVIEVEVTSNRGDCLGYIGIARELAAVTGKELKIPQVVPAESNKDAGKYCSVEITEPDLCGRYTARIIEGVKVGPSPDWLKKRLEAVGMRSVNNVVDATNYAMLETGQPPHAFDYEKIAGGKIIVRKAVAGEQLVSIDGTRCSLEPDMLIIADAEGPVAVAGVMGGLDTEVSDKTKTVLLEDAYFKPVSVRTTSRKLGLPSEAAFRFERTVDIENIDWASKRTAQLIIAAAGGKAAKGAVDVYPKKPQQVEVTLRMSRLQKLLGIEIPPDEAMKILSSLNYKPRRKDDSIICSIPSWRRADVYREADLIEEVARLYGYNKIPTGKKIQIEVAPADARWKLTGEIETYLNGCGFYETINMSFVDDSVAGLFADGDDKGHLAVKDESRPAGRGRDESSKSTNLLRRSLIGSLLGVLKTNLNAKNTPCRIFEIADTFVPSGKSGDLPIERTKLAIVCDGDLRELRGVVEGLVKTVNKNAGTVFTPSDLPWAGTGARILVNGGDIGAAGIVSQQVREKFDFKLSPVAAELDFDELLGLHAAELKAEPIPRFPAIQRDLSIVIDEGVCWTDIIEAVNKKAPEQLENVSFVGIYRGKGIPSGRKSVTLTLTFRDEDGTLTHETVDRFQQDILQSLTESVGAELRTL